MHTWDGEDSRADQVFCPVFPTQHPHLGTEPLGPPTGSRWAVGARLPWGRNEASTRAHIPELKTELPQARDQRGAQAWVDR